MCKFSLRNIFKSASLVLLCVALSVQAEPWPDVQKRAAGQTVYFYAWGGSNAVNQYLRWADRQLHERHQVRLKHVKVADIAEAVSRLKNDARAGRTDGGAIDLVWINGENFHALKKADLLTDNLWQSIPRHTQLLTDQLALESDFGEPVDGLEVPWGMGQFNLLACGECFDRPAVTPRSLLELARARPGRVSYPRPPDFVGTTFLKSVLLSLSDGDPALYRPADAQAVGRLLPLLWDYLDELHPLMWQAGQAFPGSSSQQTQWFANGKLALAMSFNPSEWQAKIQSGRLPADTSRHHFADGAITNSHYLAIPRNASHKAGARVAINFLLSAEAQSRKADTAHWGDPPVVALPGDKSAEPLPVAQELHASWQTLLEQRWLERYQ